MKQALQLRTSQQLTLTPQLQHAIQLLQLSTLDLAQEIQHTLENNPMLETEQEDTVQSEVSATAKSEDCIPQELALDTQWSDIYQHEQRSNYSAETFNFENCVSTQEDLHTHLMWQLELSHISETDCAIATAIIEAIDNNGLLSCSLADIQASFASPHPPSIAEITAVLHLVQQFEPAGVAARNVEECLSIQLMQLPSNTPWRNTVLTIIDQHMALLAKRDYKTLRRRIQLSTEDFQACMKLMQSLSPHPAAKMNSEPPDYITPDVIVHKHNGRWHAILNSDRLPKLHINGYYASLLKQVKEPNDQQYLRDQLQEAKWFLKSINNRNETLMRVASLIINKQSDFLAHGAESMKPLILNDIASELGLHESTISRISRRKYMLTPHGVFELKYFFSSHVETQNGGECSATAIRALIKKLIANENAQKPLSDNSIALLLKKQGIKIARRTIAKYRENMAILPSHERKPLLTIEGD